MVHASTHGMQHQPFSSADAASGVGTSDTAGDEQEAWCIWIASTQDCCPCLQVSQQLQEQKVTLKVCARTSLDVSHES
eukprot:131818-Pelagomonas_calceolata.AAC.10